MSDLITASGLVKKFAALLAQVKSSGDADDAAAQNNRFHVCVLRIQAAGRVAPSTLPLVSGRHEAATITSR